MSDRIKVHKRPQKLITREYEGLVACDAEPDEGTEPLTIRVGGVDVLTELADVTDRLRDPVRGVFTIDGAEHKATRLDVDRAEAYGSDCGDGCCTYGNDWSVKLDGYQSDRDLVTTLRLLHGREVKFSYVLTGYVPPLVTAKLAHHFTLRGMAPIEPDRHYVPGDEITLPLPQMLPLAAMRLRKDHAAQVKALRA